jgi:hypothetical protein
MAIEIAVSRAVTRIHALERAVHDSGPWTMDLDGLIVPAQRIVGEHGVRFLAHFPQNFSDRPIILRSGEEEVWASSAPIPMSMNGFEVALELLLPAGVAA